MEIAEFLRAYSMRAPNVPWFLGAGASAASGIRTAYDVIWDLKRILYCSYQKVPLSACSDIGDPILRARIQAYFDARGGYPKMDAEEEYTHYFEETFPSEQDRQKYIQRMVTGGAPSYGHLVLAALIASDKVHLLWTTNFDTMIEDASISALGSSGKLVVATLESRQLAIQAINDGNWPVLGKLHGDFRSRQLKNTTEELRAQDIELRHALIEGCRRFGLAVVGYSGRDASIMDSLEEALEAKDAFPNGLFWFHRAGGTCLPRVVALIERAQALGVDAHLVAGGTFDELFADILRFSPDLPSEVTEKLNRTSQRITDVPLPDPGQGWPILRMNGLLVTSYPAICRRVKCDIGGTSEVRQAVTDANADLIVGRTQFGVLAFGRDTEVTRTFEPFKISETGVQAIEVRRLRYESAELGMLYDALARAIARERPLLVERRSRAWVARVDLTRLKDPSLQALSRACGSVTGTVPRTHLKWVEAVRLRIEHRWNRLWLLVEPSIWVEPTDDDALYLEGRDFIRSRLARRYNRPWNAVLDGWIMAIVGSQNKLRTLRAFGIADGIDAAFVVSPGTGYSKARTGGR